MVKLVPTKGFRAVRLAVALAFALLARTALALPPDVVHDLALGESDERAKAIGALVTSGDASALPLLQAMIDGNVKTVGDKTVLIVNDGKAVDAATGAAVTPLPENLDDVVVNN